jgi:hypothetical protein
VKEVKGVKTVMKEVMKEVMKGRRREGEKGALFNYLQHWKLKQQAFHMRHLETGGKEKT